MKTLLKATAGAVVLCAGMFTGTCTYVLYEMICDPQYRSVIVKMMETVDRN